MIETRRLEIRQLKFADHIALNELFSDPEVMNFSMSGTKTSDEVKVWLATVIEDRKTSKGINLFAVVNKQKSTLVGYCGLTEFPDIDGVAEVEVGYRLIRKYWGQGFATEAAIAVRDYAFVDLGLGRLVALIDPTNKRSICVAEKIGMSYEKEVMLEAYDYPDHLYSIKNTALST